MDSGTLVDQSFGLTYRQEFSRNISVPVITISFLLKVAVWSI